MHTNLYRPRPAPAAACHRAGSPVIWLRATRQRGMGCMNVITVPRDYAMSSSTTHNNAKPANSAGKPAPPQPKPAAAAALSPPSQLPIPEPALAEDVLYQWATVSKPLAGLSSAVGFLLVGALGTSLAALLSSLGSFPAVPFLEPFTMALEQHQVPADAALHALIVSLLGTAGVVLFVGTSAFTRRLRAAANDSTQWLQQQAVSTAGAIKETMDKEVQQELLVIRTLQDELEAETRRLRREVNASAAMQLQLRDKEEQLQQWERSARRENKAAARLADEAKLAAEAQMMELQARLQVQDKQLSDADGQLDSADMQLRMADEALGVLGGALEKETAARTALANDLMQAQRFLQAEMDLRRETEAQMDVIWKELEGVLSRGQLTALQQRVACPAQDASTGAVAAPKPYAQDGREPRELKAIRLQRVAAQQGRLQAQQAAAGAGGAREAAEGRQQQRQPASSGRAWRT